MKDVLLPGCVLIHPRLVNSTAIDAYTLGVIVWCAGQKEPPTLEDLARRLEASPAFVRVLIADVKAAGFEMRVRL